MWALSLSWPADDPNEILNKQKPHTEGANERASYKNSGDLVECRINYDFLEQLRSLFLAVQFKSWSPIWNDLNLLFYGVEISTD